MKILVTGGLGYIGSHTAVVLLEKGYEVLLVDNLSNTRAEVLDGIEAISGKRPEWLNIDLADPAACRTALEGQHIDGIIHFAAYKAVGESVQEPLKYYQNNLGSLVNLLDYVSQHPSCGFIFSSSCTVYGDAEVFPITEESPIKPAESPYGNTKQIGEEIIQETAAAKGLKTIALRYFNPIGAHSSALIGELPLGIPQTLVPYITQSAAGLRGPLSVYGNDYPTPDGTPLRDYIHVMDLANAHRLALERILSGNSAEGMEIFNLGTGTGSSVLQVIQAFERVTNEKLEWSFAPRREGDQIATYADTTKAREVLGWEAKRSLDDAMRDAWAWQLALGSDSQKP
jgi:UDP-glucose 4-epimerase